MSAHRRTPHTRTRTQRSNLRLPDNMDAKDKKDVKLRERQSVVDWKGQLDFTFIPFYPTKFAKVLGLCNLNLVVTL